MDLEMLADLARSLNEQPPVELPPSGPTRDGGGAGDRPGDDFNRRASWDEVLPGKGWVVARRTGDVTHWRRPGKKPPGTSATTGKCHSAVGGDLLYVFSSNAQPFEPERCYSKFSAYALLYHRGDFGAAASQLAREGFGEQGAPGAKVPLTQNGEGPREPRPDAETSDDPLDGDATAADLIAANAVIRWAWEGWLPVGALTILASEPGIGKTRFCGDLLRRVHNGLPWPDGRDPTFPKGAVVLWIPADNQHAELGSLPAAFGFPPEALYLNATRRNPFVGTMLDDEGDLRDFERRVARVRPALTFVDTSLNATDRTAHKPEDAKAFFKPLQDIAARQQVVLVCVTHLNAAGKPLGRRIEGQGRVVLMMEKPDPEQDHRRKLYVRKSHSLYPNPLGVTMGSAGNEYDLDPPKAPEKEAARIRTTGEDSRLKQCCDWLVAHLGKLPQRVSHTRHDAEAAGFGSATLYEAKRVLGVVQFDQGGYKWWRLPRPEDAPAEA
jgi:hypothetical protein